MSVPPELGDLQPDDVVAIGLRLEALGAAEARYDDRQDPDGLDQALAVFAELEREPSWSRVSARLRAEVELRVVAIARERYETRGDPADLQRAMALVEDAATIARGEYPELLPAALRSLAEQLVAAFEREGRRATLDRAVAALDEAGASDSAVDFARGQTLLLRFKAFGDPTDADEACGSLERVLLAAAEAGRAQTHDGLGCALLARSELPGRDADLDRAIGAFEAAVALDPASPWWRVNLAAGLGARFERDGDRDDAERSAQLLDDALQDIPPSAPDRRRVEQNAAVASARLAGGTPGVGAARQLVEQTPAGARARPARLAALADALLVDFQVSLDPRELDEAVSTHRAALDAAETGAEHRPAILDGLGRALALRYAAFGDAAALDEAIATAERAVLETRPGASELAQHRYNLGRACSLRAARTGAPAAAAATTEAFREACAAALGNSPSLAVVAGRTWGHWAAEEQAFAQAAEALSRATEAADRLYRTQVGRRHKEAWLSLAPSLASETAVAFVQAGDAERAVLTLERGRARLLADALDRDRAELAELEASGHGELAAEYRAAARALETQASRDARRRLDHVVARIRDVGHEGFLSPIELADVRAAAQGGPLAYLATAGSATALLVVRPDGEIEADLLDLDEFTVRLRAAELRAAQARRAQAPEDAGRVLREVVLWLGDALWPRLARLAGDGDRLVLVPAGLFGLLPLHAAAWHDDRAPTGLRYALDERLITFAPSARAAAATAASAQADWPRSVLAVGAPARQDIPPLALAAAEAEAVRASLPGGCVLTGSAATAENVAAELDAHAVLHFACHGRADLREPLSSALLLAGEDELTVADVLARRVPGCRLAVLSACETSVAGVALPDEVVSLPVSLLQAGAAGVVGTLWPVDDRASMLVVRRLFAALAEGGSTPAEALRAAQQWLRDTPNEALHAAFPDVAETAPPPLPDALLRVWATATGHAAPEHWAAFTYMGA